MQTEIRPHCHKKLQNKINYKGAPGVQVKPKPLKEHVVLSWEAYRHTVHIVPVILVVLILVYY